MATKEVSISIDLDKLQDQIIAKNQQSVSDTGNNISVRSTIFTTGKDARIGIKKKLSTPDFYLIEILHDRMNNPYIQLNWKVLRTEIDSGKIVGFNIYRRRLQAEQSISFKGILDFDVSDVDKIAKGNKKFGKFFSERSAIYNIKRGSVPLQILNPNLANIENYAKSKLFDNNKTDDSPSVTAANFERFFSNLNFEKLAYIDYSQFLNEEKNKFLFVKDRNFVNLNYKDKKVGYEETFEYYIESVSKTLEEAPQSEIIRVTIENLLPIDPPLSLIAKQISEKQITVCIRINPKDQIKKAIIYRKSSDEVVFDQLEEINNLNDSIVFVDSDIQYTKSYTYRVFLQNIYGHLSEPKEITVFSSVQKITPQTRSNSLKIPIITAVQDQNSDFIKVTIYPNDPKISFYELKRRDLTIFETKFSVPSKDETNYGGTGWPINTFFVSKEKILENSGSDAINLKTRTSLKEITFIDTTSEKNHIYQYRTRGYDLFNNASSYSLCHVKCSGKKSLRTPFNIKAQILRGYPFRIKLQWDDDNLKTLNQPLLSGSSDSEKVSKIFYKVERRRLNESVYESFPLTENNFIIDEVSTIDAVLFNGEKIDDTFGSLSNSSNRDEKTKVKDEIRRAFKLPAFLSENDIYYYRISAVSDIREESNASEEFQISTLADLSNPVNFSARLINTKVKPTVVRLSWDNEEFKSIPDYWTIERKVDSVNDSFLFLGKSYIETEFFDRNVQQGKTYLYRIRAYDSQGRQSNFTETRIIV